MQLESFAIHRFALPLCRPLTLANQLARHREGCLVSWRDDEDCVGWGEVSPLPGLNLETLDQAIDQVTQICQILVGCNITMDGFWGGDWLPKETLHPSVAFGLECSLLDLLAKNSGLGLADILRDGPAKRVPVAGLLHGHIDDVLKRAKELVDAGYGCLKLKVGRGRWQDDADLVDLLRKHTPESVHLRLDGNRGWSVADALCFARCVGRERIEFVEEPIHDPTDLPEYVRKSVLPVALDETVAEQGLDLFVELEHVVAVVMKPTRIGGVRRCCSLSERCREKGMMPIVSSSFESSVGLLALASLAACVQNPGVATGLGTLDWYQVDLIEPGLLITDGAIDVSTFGRCLRWIQQDCLEEVAHG